MILFCNHLAIRELWFLDNDWNILNTLDWLWSKVSNVQYKVKFTHYSPESIWTTINHRRLTNELRNTKWRGSSQTQTSDIRYCQNNRCSAIDGPSNMVQHMVSCIMPGQGMQWSVNSKYCPSFQKIGQNWFHFQISCSTFWFDCHTGWQQRQWHGW